MLYKIGALKADYFNNDHKIINQSILIGTLLATLSTILFITSKNLQILYRQKRVSPLLVTTIIWIVVQGLLFGCFYLTYQIFERFEITFDILSLLYPKPELFLAMVLIGLILASLLRVSWLLLRFSQPWSKNGIHLTIRLMIATIFGIGLYRISPELAIFLGLLNLYFITLAHIPRSTLGQALSYRFVIIIVTLNFIIGLGIGLYSSVSNNQRSIDFKKALVKNLIEYNPVAQRQLIDLGKVISRDPVILRAFDGPSSPYDIIPNLIKRKYLDDSYFTKYSSRIYIFGSRGMPLEDNSIYQQYLKDLEESGNSTWLDNVLFVSDPTKGIKRYFSTIPIKRGDYVIANLAIDLTIKNDLIVSDHPAFVSEYKNYIRDLTGVSYAIFENDILIFSHGPVNYNAAMLNAALERRQYETKDYAHYAIQDEDLAIIVSTRSYPIAEWISTAIFYFFLYGILSILLLYGYNQLINQKSIRLKFATKVQLIINLAFFVPITVLTAVLISLLSNSDQSSTQELFFDRARTITEQITYTLFNRQRGFVDQDSFDETVRNIATLTQTDVHVYDEEGNLLLAENAHLKKLNLLGNYINPQAYSLLVEEGQNSVMLNEKVADLNYQTIYTQIISPVSGNLLGIVGIPFFGAKFKFDKHIVNVITTVLDVLFIMFLVLIVLSYFSTKSLTAPLILIANKLHRTSLLSKNELLDIQRDDEFGTIISEYNRMVTNLEKNKTALAENQKELAWKEMAKQVAHEIKNPLTPMKLYLQQLQRIEHLDPEMKNRVVSSMIQQIDNLSEIATSFSAFAQMPTPVYEPFTFDKIVSETVLLYSKGNEVDIRFKAGCDNDQVYFDPKLFSRILTNLILNGIESVPGEREPRIRVQTSNILLGKTKYCVLSVSDNGDGIPLDIQQSVFVPNFSTKSGGSGIGLAITKRGIEQANGKIWFETEEDVGTTFFIQLQMHEPTVNSEPSNVTSRLTKESL
jgi:signal transduction histidine kinase